MRHPSLRIASAILLGLLILLLSSLLMMIISRQSNMFIRYPGFEKVFTHTSILVFSVLFIIILSKGKPAIYGFTWNRDFPVFKIVIISLLIGSVSTLLSRIPNIPQTGLPASDYSFFEKIVYVWLWASICEEVLTRGLVQGFLAPLNHYGIKLTGIFISLPVIVGALFFGAMHLMLLSLGTNPIAVLIIVFFGIILGLIAGYYKERSGSLIPAIIVHMCFNIGVSLVSSVTFIP